MVRFKHTTDALTGGSSGFQFLCGAIQTPKPRYVVNPLICFNSYMVRFKLGQITLSLSPIGFQFLYGAIQTSSNFLLECCHLGVSIPIWCDSNYTNDYSNVNFSRFQFHMVRFKPSSFSSTMGTLFMFQFLYGAIQTKTGLSENLVKRVFQFLYAAIKTADQLYYAAGICRFIPKWCEFKPHSS